MIKLSKFYKLFVYTSLALITISIVLVAVFKLDFGIDFTGGSLLEVSLETRASTAEVAGALDLAGFPSQVQLSEEDHYIIKTKQLNQAGERDQVFAALSENFGAVEEYRFDSIGPVVGNELRRRAIWQTGFVLVGILLYVAYAFRNVNQQKNVGVSSWRFSWASILALVHDIAILLGVFAVLGKLLGAEVDTLFVTALLTTLGFSVNDTIVVFDRLRENVQRYRSDEFADNIDRSVNETLARSLNTSGTLLFVLLALALFGGQSIFYFSLALIVGVAVGTYSSIFVASALLLAWNKK